MRDHGNADTGLPQRCLQTWRELQSGRRRRNGAGAGGEHRLVILVIGRGAAIRPPDIGRQRHGTMRRQAGLNRRRVKRAAGRRIDEFNHHFAAIAAAFNPRRKAMPEQDHIIRAAFACRLGKDPPARAILMLVKRDTDPRLAAPA